MCQFIVRMAGFGDYTGYNRPFGLDPNREPNDLYDTRYQQIYGYHTPATEEYQGPPLVMDDIPDEGMVHKRKRERNALLNE